MTVQRSRLRQLLGAHLPRDVARTGDPFAVLRYAASCGENTGYFVERQLPDPFLLNQVVEVLGATPERYLFIAATAADVQAAQAAGIPALGYGIPGAATIESMSELVVDELIKGFS